MKSGKRSGLFICAGLLTLGLLSACGNSSSSSSSNIPEFATIFYAHTVVKKGDGTLKATGYNAFGQLGNGNLNSQSSLVPVATLTAASLVATGADHTLAVSGNKVYSWGSNYLGQLGTSTPTTGVSAYSSTPLEVPITGAVAVTDVAAGWLHSLAVVDGDVWSWGYNGSGQLGDGNNVRTAPVAKVDRPAAIPFTNVAAGGSHSVALDLNGKVYAWGLNDYGQAGSAAVLVLAPAPVQLDPAGELDDVKQIAAGGGTNYAVKKDGTVVWAWGFNGFGRLGIDPATTPSRYTAAQVPIALPAGVTVEKVSAGLRHALALLRDAAGNGTVVAWGYNGFSQLGDNTTVSSHIPVQVLDATGAVMSGVTDVIAFGNHSLALAGGKWYGWGDNGYGQLGNPVSNTTTAYITKPVEVGGF